jgi:16S rRNA (guanine527-N7)-methyltransferase
LHLSDAQCQHLLTYIDLLQKWNRVYNLTAVKDPEQMLTQHVLDCLAAVRPLKEKAPWAKSLLDVGAGGGLPSVVLAIACPDLTVLAVDAVAKKTAFIQSTAHTLGLVNLQAQHARVESLSQTFDVVSARAYASLNDLVLSSRACLAPNGWWMAMKGATPTEEISHLPSDIEVVQTQRLSVPDLDAQRCLVWMRPKQPI